MNAPRDYISRTLSWHDHDLKAQTVRDVDIAARFTQPVVILGDPGIGKTWLMEMLGAQDSHTFIRAASLLRQPDGHDFGDVRLIIDGLDEVAAINEGDPLHNVLSKLIRCGRPPFVISCRSAEWRYATGKIDIDDEYGVLPQVLNLELLDEDDAVAALGRRADAAKAKKAIYALKQAGLSEFYRNPLYLEFVAAIIKDDGELPKTRAELYDSATAQLCRELNPRYQGKGVDALSKDAALTAAGAVMAAMLITGENVVSNSASDADGLGLADLAELASMADMRALIRSNLFKSLPGDSGYFAPLHRTVAEFLGARWLAKHVDAHPDSRHMAGRIIGLIAAEGGVPSSLRGLHAWLPRFSPARLGLGSIDRDPYGIIRYGDGDGLSADQSTRLIDALRQLAAFNPWFREGYWASESIGALAQPALLDEIRLLINDEEESYSLRSLILEALADSPCVLTLKNELEAIMLAPQRTYRERRYAGEAIAKSDLSFDWEAALSALLKLRSVDSARLATELLDDIGFDAISVDLIASVIIANAQLFAAKTKEARTFGTLYRIQNDFPVDRIASLLDALADRILPKLDPEKWWSDGYNDRWSEFATLVRRLVVRLLQNDAASVAPSQLWNWLRMIEREYMHGGDERTLIAQHMRDDDRLRRGVQRLAILGPRAQKAYHVEASRLQRLSNGLGFSDDDAIELLREVVANNDPQDRERWMAFVAHFRTDGVIPVEIRKIARPYARKDETLLKFLISKPERRKLDDWDKKHRKSMRERAKRDEVNRKKTQAEFSDHMEEMRRGELRWLVHPARIFLAMFSDVNKEASPVDRVAESLGADIADAAVTGFEASLYRDDLPSADQIAQSYAESKVWNYIYPMLAGAGQRMIDGRMFDGLSDPLVSALAIGCEHELLSGREKFDGLEDALNNHLRRNPAVYETHLRRKFEPFLAAKFTHIFGLYGFARSKEERPLSMRLSLEWLQRFPKLPFDVERELAGCLVYGPEDSRDEYWPAIAAIARDRLAKMKPKDEAYRYWRGIQLTLDFDEAVQHIPVMNARNRDWIWFVSRTIYQKHREREDFPVATLKHLRWIVDTFRHVWPHISRPSGPTSGDENPWEATELIEWAIYQIANDPSEEGAAVLRTLRDDSEDGYTATVQSAIATQHRTRLEANFQTPTLSAYKAVLSETGQPQNAADVQAIILGELDYLQERLRGDALNPVNNFYEDTGKPRTENPCRDQMLLALGPSLPFGIQAPPEVAMPQGNRSDGAFVYRDIAVPLECKGQWHDEVWTAAAGQLDRYYSTEHKAASKGIYLVFWFGPDAPKGRKLKSPPKDAPRPTSAREMQIALQTLLPVERRADIAICVLDLTRP